MPEEETLQHETEAEVEMVEVICLSQVASGSRATPVASPAPNEQQVQEVTLQSAAPQKTVRGSRAAAVVTSPPILR
ncbi:unnamed protein product [Parnassius apollo]|uniref:(apollo) hypothetical protein n=1 Tax=Parnassius apollo TaxID=110799 RepID=A0A8S3W025_PARAO|nr:unnamed protein product [Parnassius apollo]